jgi:hypothetical protein
MPLRCSAGVQVVRQIAERLSALHAAGYAHRDVKPNNILRLPRHGWILIDYGCTARIGELVAPQVTLEYAAPEAVRAHDSRQGMLAQVPLLAACMHCAGRAAHCAHALRRLRFSLLLKRRALLLSVVGHLTPERRALLPSVVAAVAPVVRQAVLCPRALYTSSLPRALPRGGRNARTAWLCRRRWMHMRWEWCSGSCYLASPGPPIFPLSRYEHSPEQQLDPQLRHRCGAG